MRSKIMPPKVGSEFLVNTNTDTSYDQRDPSIVSLFNGNFLVTWQESNWHTSEDIDLDGQVFTAAGSKVGPEFFLINTHGPGTSFRSSVASLSNGNFVVTWVSFQEVNFGISGQIFTAAAAKVGSEFLVNTYRYGIDIENKPSVASLSNGNFVVTWSSYPEDLSRIHNLYGQKFTAVGSRVDSQFLVNTYGNGDQKGPSVASLSNGNFVVTWSGQYDDGSNYGVYGQVFTAAGSRIGSQFLVNTYVTGEQRYPSVASLSNGNFVVTWDSDIKIGDSASKGQDGSYSGVYGQVFTADAAKVGSEFLVNTHTDGFQGGSSVASLTNGKFVVTWASRKFNSQNNSVYGQVFTADAAKVGSEFLVTDGFQGGSSVASLTNGKFVVIWSGYPQNFSFDMNVHWDINVYGQVFQTALSATHINTTIRYTEDTAYNFNNIDIFSLNPMVGVNLTLSDSLAGVLTTNSSESAASYDPAKGIWRASGALLDVNTLLANLQFVPSQNYDKNFTIAVSIQDGAETLSGAITLTGIAMNDAPTLSSSSNSALTFTENDDAVLIDATVMLTDVDNADLSSAAVSITTGFLSSEDVLLFNNQNGIAGSYDSTTGILTLTGISTVANYQAALRSVKYKNLSENPSATARTISFVVNDGSLESNGITRVINITPVNDSPMITTNVLNNALTFTENDDAVPIDSIVTLTDVDNADLSSATVSITTGFSSSEDVLLFNNQNGITGSYNLTTGILTLTGISSVANYQAALRSVKYKNLSENPSATARTISFVVNDGNSNSNAPIRTINITPINDAPNIQINTLPVLRPGENFVLTAANIQASDPDTLDANLQFTVSNVTAGYFERIGAPGVAIDSFSQADINAHTIRFVQNGASLTPAYNLRLSDGSLSSAPSAVTILPSSSSSSSLSSSAARNTSAILIGAIAGGGAVGAAAIGLIIAKLMITRQTKQSLQAASSQYREVTLFIAKQIFDHIKTTGLMGYRSRSETERYLNATEILVTQLERAGVETDLRNLSVKNQARLFKVVAHHTEKTLLPKRSWCSGFFSAEISPEQLSSGASKIADTVYAELCPDNEMREVSAVSKNPMSV